MNWYDMPENTPQDKARKEIAECNYCINGLCRTMQQMRVPKNQWRNNVIVKAYLERIDEAQKLLHLRHE